MRLISSFVRWARTDPFAEEGILMVTLLVVSCYFIFR